MAEKTLSNVRIVHKHDVEANWQRATGFTPKKGELIIYDIDATHSYVRIKIGDGTTNVNELSFIHEHITDALTNAMPKVTSITMLASNWNDDGDIWSQVVTCNGVSANSKLDLQPTPAQLVELQDSEISLMATNNNGVVTIYAIGDKPTSDTTMQILITEVAVV